MERLPKKVLLATDASRDAAEDGVQSLVVVSSRGLGLARRMLLGSTSTKVLRAAVGPILVCPHDQEP
jgi:nucleotide-binding universal stress UspA family protein